MKLILFWSEFNNEGSLDEWLGKEVTLSEHQLLAIKSYERFGNEYEIYSYQSIAGLDGVISADDILPSKTAYRALKAGHSIAHVSDYVRMRVASRDSGIVLDLDGLALRKLPDEAFYTSLPARKTGAYAVKFTSEPHLPLYVNDNSWDGKALSCFPIGVDERNAKAVDRLSDRIYKALTSPPRKGSGGWNFIMWSLGKLTRYDSSIKAYAPLHFCPVPGWLGKGKCYSIESPTRFTGDVKLFEYELPSVDEILENSFVVQHFFESAFKGAEKHNFDFKDLPKDTLLYREYEYINSP